MKTLINFTLFLIFIGINISAYSQVNSRVSTFHYGGFGDNLFATLHGSIFSNAVDKNAAISVDSLYGVEMIIFDSTNTIFRKVRLESTASYSIEIPGGVYKIIFDKKGYQPIIITNYKSVADQLTQLDIILEKGYEIQYHEIPN